MPSKALALPETPRTFAQLLQCVKRVLIAGQREIEFAWTRTYLETGRLINAHLLAGDTRAEYGARVYTGLRTPSIAI